MQYYILTQCLIFSSDCVTIMGIIGFLIALVMLSAIALVFIMMDNGVADEGVPAVTDVDDHQHQHHQQEEAGQVKQDVAHPPARDALVDPDLVDEPDQGDDQLDGGQDVEDKTPECHYEMTRFLGAVQYCGETVICFILATAGVIFTIAVILFIKKK